MERATQYINCYNPTRLQAEFMAGFAQIDITPEQIKDYVWARQSDEPCFMGMSDQNILHLVLTPEQRTIFEREFCNIRF